MHILFVNSVRAAGGGSTSALELARGLAGRGARVTVVCHPRSVIRRRLEGAAGIEVMPVAIRAEANPWRVVQLAAAIGRLRPHVLLADRRKDVKLSWLARAPWAGLPLVHRHGAPSPLRNSALYRAVWTRLDALIVNSQAMQRLLLERTPWLERVPMHVIHNGKDLMVYRPRPELRSAMRQRLGLPDSALVACFHGALQARKNVDVLIRAVALAPADRNVHALIVGTGEAASSLRELASSLNVAATFAGEREDIPAVLAAADMAVHPSGAEGFANSVVEALACGLPVIASAAASHGEQIEDGVCGQLVPLRDARALCHAMVRLADERERLAMSQAARQRAEAAFDLRVMIARYEAVLERAVEARRTRTG